MKFKLIYQTLVDEPSAHEHIKILKNALSEYNAKYLGDKISYFVTTVSDLSQIVAGAFVWHQNNTMYLDTLFVDEKYRGHKIGETLLSLSEKKGKELGCNQCIIDTLGFQAQAFYEKHGYIVFASVPKYQGGYDRVYLKKEL